MSSSDERKPASAGRKPFVTRMVLERLDGGESKLAVVFLLLPMLLLAGPLLSFSRNSRESSA